jgi:MscS family membrane protein
MPTPVPEDPFDRGTPRRNVAGFLEAARRGDFARAREYLDLRNLPAARREERGADLARQLYVVLERNLWIEPELLSDDPQGDTRDDLPESREIVGTLDTGIGSVPIELQRMPREDDVPVWRVSAATVRRIPDLYERLGYSEIERRLPDWMLAPRALGISVWIVVALTGLLLAVAASAWIAIALLERALRLLTRHTPTDVDEKLVRATAGPLRLGAGVGLFRAGRAFLTFSAPAQRVFSVLETTLLVAAVAWFVLRLVDLFTLVVLRRLQVDQRGASLAWIPLAQKAVKGVVVALGGVVLLDRYGFDVTALLASLGLGGIVVALAAQKSMENFFGGVSVLVDRPVAVGDFCRVGEIVGRVEEIGLRSTRVRTLERTVVSIPNADFSARQIENFDARDLVWYHPILGLRYDTRPDQLRRVLERVRELLRSHPRLEPGAGHVRFFRFGDYSLDLEVFAYVKTRDYEEFLAIAEELNLRIMEIVAACGSALALPSQAVYLDGSGERRAQTGSSSSVTSSSGATSAGSLR